MTKKARRRQIMEACSYPELRVKQQGDGFVYKRRGDLLKEELKVVMKELDCWEQHYEHHHKRAWRGHIRDAMGMEYEGMGWERFSLHELTQIWREVSE